MALTIPVIPQLPAGHIATVAEMNQLSAACTFLLGKPAARVHDGAGAVSIGTSATAIAFNTKDYDTDSMWSSGANTRLTIQTPGWYKFRCGITTATSGAVVDTSLRSTTGSNNPAGSGIVSAQHWAGYTVVSGTTVGGGGSSGIWPFYLYAGDFLQVMAQGQTAATTDVSVTSSFFGLEMVSV